MSERVSAKDIASAQGVSKQAVVSRANSAGWRYSVGFNRARLYDVDSLPEDVKAALSLSKGRDALSLYNKDRVTVVCPDLTAEQNSIALARSELVRKFSGHKEKANGKKGKAARTFIKGYNTGNLFPRVYEVLGATSLKTVERWVKQLKDASFEYTALAPRYGNRKGCRKTSDAEVQAVLQFALHPNRLRKSEAVRLAKLKLEKNGVASPSSEATLLRALDDWGNSNFDQWVFAREGEKALNDKVLPYLERDSTLLEVGDVLVADGHILNFNVLHPFTGKPIRPTLLCWYDWASRMPLARQIMATEDTQCISAALRSAILRLGKVPRVAYLDNGRAFKSKFFTSKDIDFEEMGFYGLYARLGMETIFAWPYHGQSKPVERFFGTFSELERLMPTYCGTSIANKPAHLHRSERLHKRIHKKRYGDWTPTIEEAGRIIEEWYEAYAGRSHRGLKGLAPVDVFEAGKGPGVDAAELNYLMMASTAKVVGRNGVSMFGRHYYDSALYGLRQRVIVKYDLEDLSQVFVYTEDGTRQICQAQPVQGVHPIARITGTKDDIAAVKAGIVQKNSLKKSTESTALEWVENAPRLIDEKYGAVEAPARPAEPEKQTTTQGEAEHIERQAEKMKVLELKPRTVESFDSEPDRYEAYLERESKDGVLGPDQKKFMRYFESTELYKELADRFEFLRELWLTDEQEVCL